jgi:hypothetical protein
MMKSDPSGAKSLFATNSFCTHIFDDMVFRGIFETMYHDEPKKTIQLYTCSSFSCRITENEFSNSFKDMTRDEPVMALRFFKTTCFITSYLQRIHVNSAVS